MSVCVNCQNIRNNVLTYKINLKSITNIGRSNPLRGIGVRSYEGSVLSGTYRCDGSITISDEFYSQSICLGVCVCACVCVSAHELVSLYHIEL